MLTGWRLLLGAVSHCNFSSFPVGKEEVVWSDEDVVWRCTAATTKSALVSTSAGCCFVCLLSGSVFDGMINTSLLPVMGRESESCSQGSARLAWRGETWSASVAARPLDIHAGKRRCYNSTVGSGCHGKVKVPYFAFYLKIFCCSSIIWMKSLPPTKKCSHVQL